MRRMMLLAGAAALAAAIPAAASDPDRGKDRGHGASAARKGPDHDRAGRVGGPRSGVDRGPLSRQERRVERAIRQERRDIVRARETQASRQERRVDAREIHDLRRSAADRRDWQAWTERRLAHRASPFRPFPEESRRSARGSCPPGLARQNAACLPPGQLRRARFIGRPLALAARPYNVPARYAYRFVDGDRYFYRYDAGSIFAFDRSSRLVTRVVPLVATGLFPGEPLPLGYDVYNVPLAYRAAFPDSGDWNHRYEDGAIYRVDTESGLVDGIVALLTGAGGLGGLGVGDPLPSGYDVYNVPLDYRDEYRDRDDALFRYADGSIYQVDPRTRMIEAVISMLG